MAKLEIHNYDPRELASTVYYTCSYCHNRVTLQPSYGGDDLSYTLGLGCPHCGKRFMDIFWAPPYDIWEALQMREDFYSGKKLPARKKAEKYYKEKRKEMTY